jgi:S1-C subfamily serine protease
LIKDVMIRRGYIGISGQNVPIHRRVVRYFNLPQERGVLVVSTEDNSPARNAGISMGDLITSFDNQLIGDIDDLQRVLAEKEIGRSYKIGVIRRTEKLEFDVTPIEAKR